MWLIYAFSASILWGLNYALAEKILRSISPITLLTLEMLLGAIVFFIFGFATKLRSDVVMVITNKSLLWLVIAETCVVLLASLFITYSIQTKNATVAGIVEITYPLFTIIFSIFLFQENHLSIPVLIGGSLILAGVIIISFA